MASLYASEHDPHRSTVTAEELSPPEAVGTGWAWVWMIAACLLLAASGLVRGWQDRRFETAKNRVISPLFPLKELPTMISSPLGTWQALEDGDIALDPQIIRIAGSTDSVVRNYVEQSTGVMVTVLVLYGRAEAIVAHTPEVCYPATGHDLVDDVIDLAVPLGTTPAVFRSLVYGKKGGTTTNRDEVFYSLRHDGRWAPGVDGNWRVLRYSPAVFKVQLQRRVAEHEQRHLNNPTEQFLALFVPELERRITDAEKKASQE